MKIEHLRVRAEVGRLSTVSLFHEKGFICFLITPFSLGGGSPFFKRLHTTTDLFALLSLVRVIIRRNKSKFK